MTSYYNGYGYQGTKEISRIQNHDQTLSDFYKQKRRREKGPRKEETYEQLG